VSDTGRPAGTRARLRRDADGLCLDVRGLECPDPLVEILGLIDRGEAGASLVVDLDQEPLFLYPELEARGWSYELLRTPDDDVGSGCRLRLTDRRQ